MQKPETCADASREAGALIAACNAVCKFRSLTPKERAAYKKATDHLECTGVYIPEWLAEE